MLALSKSGMSFVEVIVSLAIVFMLSLFLLPNFIILHYERTNLMLENMATQILFEELQLFRLSKVEAPREVTYQSHLFSLTFEENETGQTVLCVSWVNSMGKQQKKCGDV
ncbi:hypothetical protein LCL95_11840 [Bacillus timonensis]|nr:hypothetical protein [Bacillus timonensis]